MKLSVEEASDNFTRFSKRLKNEELRNLLKHMDERSQRITLNNCHLTNYQLNLLLDYINDLQEIIDMFLDKVDRNKMLLNNPDLLDLYLKIKEVIKWQK